MEKDVFLEHFRRAAAQAHAFAQTCVLEVLPAPMVFDVLFKLSDDLPEDEAYAVGWGISLEAAAERFFRDGAVPEWIDLAVASEDGQRTIVAAHASRRFALDDGLMHYGEGMPPFHVQGPSMPRDRAGREPFSLHWTMCIHDAAQIDRVLAHRDQVEDLTLLGETFDDAAVVSQRPRALERRAARALRRPRARLLAQDAGLAVRRRFASFNPADDRGP